MAKDYYNILGVPSDASDAEIKKAYRKLAMQYHPDRNPGKEEWANQKFKEINEAYGALGDPQKRKQFDRFGTAGGLGDIFSSSATRTTFEDVMRDFGGQGLGFDFLDSIFGNLFKGKNFSFQVYGNGFAPGSGFTSASGIDLDQILRQTKRQTQRNVNYEITITSDQAQKGMEKDLVRKGKKLRVKIPAGVKSGTKIRLRNARTVTDNQPGDIIVTVRI